MQKLPLKNPEPYIRFVNNYRPNYSYVEQKRVLYDHEMMYVMNGSVEMHYGEKIYPLKKGDVFYLEPGVENYIVVKEEWHFRTHCIHFDWLAPLPEYDFTAEEFYMHSVLSSDYHKRLEKIKERPIYVPQDFSLPNFMGNVPYERLSALFAKCCHAFCGKDAVSQIKLKSAFWAILSELTDCFCAKTASPIHPKILYAMEYLRANYTQSISVPQLAEKYCLSSKYFGALFKGAAGVSVSEYVLRLRLFAAKEMLLGTDMKIEEIAERTGFQNPFYFSKCFRQQEKLSPSEYRSLLRS